VELAADRGWPPEQNEWRLLFAVSEVYGGKLPGERGKLFAPVSGATG